MLKNDKKKTKKRERKFKQVSNLKIKIKRESSELHIPVIWLYGC
jgi:hypothetical protein